MKKEENNIDLTFLDSSNLGILVYYIFKKKDTL